MPEGRARKLLIVGWDAADWNLITPLMDGGLMPTLAKFVEQGCMGNLATLHPCLSPMLWTSIATGKLPDAHGIAGFVEPTEDHAGVRLVGSQSRRCKALWNITSEAGLRTHVVGWYASHPAEAINGVCVSDQYLTETANGPSPASTGWIAPPDLADRYAGLRVSPRELGAGDMLPFIPRLEQVDLRRDPRPGRLADALAACASIHAVATDLMASQPWDVFAVYYDALDRIGHDFMPYHPPRLTWIAEEDFSVYQHVMTGMYRFHDMLLERLLQLAGEDATVILLSDHGFRSDHQRPRVEPGRDQHQTAAQWHRQYGIVAMRGPGLRADERIYGATLLDIAPTVLTLLGLPVARDMPGRPLVAAFDPPPRIDAIATYETGGSATAPREPDPAASAEAVRQLVELGYLAAEADGQAMARQATRERQYNLGVVCLTTGRPGRAIEHLAPLVEQHPEEFRYVMALATALAADGRHQAVIDLLRPLESRGFAHADMDVALANAFIKLGDSTSADQRLARAESSAPNHPQVHASIGSLRLLQQRFGDARQAYARAIELDPDNPLAHHGMAQAMLRLGQAEPAAESALRAVGLIHGFPEAHHVLGLALAMMGDEDRAILAFRTAIGLHPGLREAHEQLAAIFLKRGAVEDAMRHRRLAEGR